MMHHRAPATVLVLAVALMASHVETSAQAQQPREFACKLDIQEDPFVKNRFATLAEYIKEKDWDATAEILCRILESSEDSWVLVGNQVWAGSWDEANRIIGTLPPQGIQAYQNAACAKANGLLAGTRQTRDFQLLANLAQRFRYTEAGFEAANQIAIHCLYKGEFGQAAHHFDHLLNHPSSEKLKTPSFVAALLAYRRAGERNKENNLWNNLRARDPMGVQLNGKRIPFQDLRTEIDRLAEKVDSYNRSAGLFRGDASRQVAVGTEVSRIGKLAFHCDLYESDKVREKVESVQRGRHQTGLILPGAHPVASGDTIVFRGHDGLQAVSIKQGGKLLWSRRILNGPEPLSLEDLINSNHVAARDWLRQFESTGSQSCILENSTIGTLSADDQRAYAIHDLAIPPVPQQMFGRPRGKANPDVKCNALQAFRLKGGKILWEHGGPNANPQDPFAETFFLGAPLPLEGKVYSLIEKGSSLAVVCLDGETGKVVWKQTLAMSTSRISEDVTRRITACPLSYSDGILVCPTCSGAVFGIDLRTHALVWAHGYDTNVRQRRPAVHFQLHGKFSAPIIARGKVVFSDPDSHGIHCLNLRDGNQCWKPTQNATDLYVAGISDDSLLVAGRTQFRAIDLKTGREQWSQETPHPAGLGVLSKTCYYLPVGDVNKKKPSSILVIDLKGKKVKDRLQPAKDFQGNDIELGNLFLHEGLLLTQTATRLTALAVE